MSPRKNRTRSSLVFAWEARGASTLLRAGRLATPLVLLALFGVSAALLVRLERSRGEERQRSADSWNVRQVVERYRNAHDGGCPKVAADVIREGFARELRVEEGTEEEKVPLESYCARNERKVSFSAYENGVAPARVRGPLE